MIRRVQARHINHTAGQLALAGTLRAYPRARRHLRFHQQKVTSVVVFSATTHSYGRFESVACGLIYFDFFLE